MWRTFSLMETIMLGKIEGRRKGDNEDLYGLMASLTRWTWVLASSRSWWWTGKPGMLQSVGSQSWLNWTEVGTTKWPSNPTPGYLPGKKKKNPLIGKDTGILMFIAALFTIAKKLKQPKWQSTDEWIKKIWYIHNGIVLSYWWAAVYGVTKSQHDWATGLNQNNTTCIIRWFP